MNDWDPMEEKRHLERALAAGVELRPGDQVILRPSARADIFDLALAGKTATIHSIDQDFENRIHVSVTVNDDPGADLGVFGHRFFFSLDEIEPVSKAATRGAP